MYNQNTNFNTAAAPQTADICLIVEGSYPYVTGGVSSWLQSLITSHKQLSFHLITLVVNTHNLVNKYQLPKNVLSLQHICLQDMPQGMTPSRHTAHLLAELKQPVLALQQHANLIEIQQILEILLPYQNQIGYRVLLNSQEAWNLILEIYQQILPHSSFINYFWSWRSLLGGLFATLIAPLPNAHVYHTISTGYAGIFAAKAKLETGKPVILTEHGIYTNERRIEILMADWLEESKERSFVFNKVKRDLRSVWTNIFESYTHACYDACDQIITLYAGNQTLQIRDGADPKKLKIIPNGIDYLTFANLKRSIGHPPTVALIGRVVPIKDVKTYIRACYLLLEDIPNLNALILGPYDEDREYYEECKSLVDHLQCQQTIQFKGQVKLTDHLGYIDAIVLTSLSEAQPLVLLEAGAAGVPSIATDVGACREMILGPSNETPPLGPGGSIVPLASPKATAEKIKLLLTDRAWHARCSAAIKERVKRYYDKDQVDLIYKQLYTGLIEQAYNIASEPRD